MTKVKFLLTIILLPLIVFSQTHNDIYYFSVGSGQYEKDFELLEDGFTGLNDVESAVESAKRIKNLFDTIGAKGGEILISKDFEFISKDLLFKRLKKSIKNVKKMKLKNPFFVFYYCGHGFTNGELQAMFIPPGDITSNPLNYDSYEDWLEYTISPLEIQEILEKSGLRYMLILDCCYEGENKEIELLNPQLIPLIGAEKLDELMKMTYGILIKMNQMVGPNPVLFSTLSGESVKVVKYTFGDKTETVGPLCRRFYKVFENNYNQKVSLKKFMNLIQSSNLDSRTRNAVSYWVGDKSASYIMW